MTQDRRIFLNIVATYGLALYALVIGLFCGRWSLMAVRWGGLRGDGGLFNLGCDALDIVNHLVYTIWCFMNVKLGISITCRYSAACATDAERCSK